MKILAGKHIFRPFGVPTRILLKVERENLCRRIRGVLDWKKYEYVFFLANDEIFDSYIAVRYLIQA